MQVHCTFTGYRHYVLALSCAVLQLFYIIGLYNAGPNLATIICVSVSSSLFTA